MRFLAGKTCSRHFTFGRPAAAVAAVPPEADAGAVLVEVIGVAEVLLGQLTETLLLLASEGFPVDTGFTVIFILSLRDHL